MESKSNWNLFKTIGAHPEIFEPLGNYLVVDIFKPEKASMGGIALPDHVVERDKQALARVIKAGPGQRAIIDAKPVPMFVKDGDLIVILKHTPIEVVIGGNTCFVISEGDVVARINEEKLQELLDSLPETVEESLKEVESVPEEVSDPLVQTESGLWVINK